MTGGAIEAALKQLAQTGRARIRVLTHDHRSTEARLRNRAAWISKPHARIRISRVEDGDGFIDADLLIDARE